MERTARGTLTQNDRKHCIVSSGRLPLLTEESVHIWTWKQEVVWDALSHLERELSPDEWRRVRRCSSNRIARRFIVRRGMLRRILGLYLNLPPHQVELIYNAHGKPFVGPDCSPPVQFNMSDSGELVALAVGAGSPLGIDIERLSPISDHDALAFSILSEPELKQLNQAVASMRTDVFFRLWTRREAIAKAEGTGLRQNSAAILLDASEKRPSPVSGSASLARLKDTKLYELILPDGYVGVLATKGKTVDIGYIDCLTSEDSLLGRWMTDSKGASGRIQV